MYQVYKPNQNPDSDHQNENENELCAQFCQDSKEEPFQRKIFTIDFGNEIIRDAKQLVQKHHKSFFGLIVILIILGLISFGGLIIYKKRKNRDYTQSPGVRNLSLKKSYIVIGLKITSDLFRPLLVADISRDDSFRLITSLHR